MVQMAAKVSRQALCTLLSGEEWGAGEFVKEVLESKRNMLVQMDPGIELELALFTERKPHKSLTSGIPAHLHRSQGHSFLHVEPRSETAHATTQSTESVYKTL